MSYLQRELYEEEGPAMWFDPNLKRVVKSFLKYQGNIWIRPNTFDLFYVIRKAELQKKPADRAYLRKKLQGWSERKMSTHLSILRSMDLIKGSRPYETTDRSKEYMQRLEQSAITAWEHRLL